jgi:hypothetical protein
MEHEFKLYSVEDIYSAFDMGLSSAIYVLERSLVLPVEDRMHILEGLKYMIKKGKTDLDK